MTEAMQTRNVFIDTSIFIGLNYNYRSPVFKNLARLARDERANVFIIDITIREIEAHIDEDISKSLQASSKFKNAARILRNIDKPETNALFLDIDERSAKILLKTQLQEFLREAKATILPTSDVSIESVFDRYFDMQPPFGEGKKKHEFPDAFVVEALENLCMHNNDLMYIVSTDQDMQSCCDPSASLIAINKLAEFIDIVEFHDDVLAPSIYTLIDNNIAAIKAAISDSFEYKGFWIEDQEGDVNSVSIDDISITDTLILDVDNESAIVQLDVITVFSADLSYDDYETAIYDHEDKIAMPWRTIETSVQRTIEYSATISVQHNIDDPNYFVLENVELDTGDDIGVFAEEYQYN